ncbi:MAG TPA: hypothetical protein VIS95_02990 [Solirubrobacterales bacterium]
MPLELSESAPAPGQVQACPVGVRRIPDEVDFVYVMRTDSNYVAAQFAERLGAAAAFEEIAAAYGRAVEALAEAILRAFSTVHPRAAIDLIDGEAVHRRRLELIEEVDADGVVISMDPLMEDGALPLAFSRCYRVGGTEFVEMIPRPGYPALEQQVEAIRAEAGGRPLIVVEDDFYTGETIEKTLSERLEGLADQIVAVVAGTKIGPHQPPAFPVHAAVRYVREDGLSPLEKVDLGDPRDYLIGASGLVCRLDSGNLGRLPYVLPFVSPAARASIPEVAEAEFSASALELSRAFYADLSQIAGGSVTLMAVDPHFAVACRELFGLEPDAPLADVLSTVERSSPLAG